MESIIWRHFEVWVKTWLLPETCQKQHYGKILCGIPWWHIGSDYIWLYMTLPALFLGQSPFQRGPSQTRFERSRIATADLCCFPLLLQSGCGHFVVQTSCISLFVKQSRDSYSNCGQAHRHRWGALFNKRNPKPHIRPTAAESAC